MKRSKHSLSHYRLTSLNMGQLVPVMCEEVLPGDTFRQQSSVLMRVAPLVAPVMHPCHLMIHHWYVPSRLLWDNWEPFITGSDPAKVLPTMTIASTDANAKHLGQHLGIGADLNTGSIVVQTLPFRAYNKIYNEFYRDQDLQAKLPERTGDTGDLVADYGLKLANWEKDYFTTARPYPQQGANEELIALGAATAPVLGLGKFNQTFPLSNQSVYESDGTTSTFAFAAHIDGTANDSNNLKMEGTAATGGFPNIRADLQNAGIKVNEWRRAMAMQRMREHRNRFGSRYRDMLAFLGITSSDARLQRPEYLGGGKQTIAFSEVLSTADTGTAVVGEMAGHGIAALRSRPYKRFFEEHGYVLSLLCVRPVSVYMQRVPRHFLRRDYEQFWQKELEMLGEQTITNFEVYGDAAAPSGTFGYIPRYDEYRHAEGSVAGEFRNVLDYWHLARDFTAQPVLNGTFVECDASERIYASATNDQLYAMVAHRIAARRLVSKRARS